MNEIYLLEQCPRGRQDLQEIVETIKLKQFINCLEKCHQQMFEALNLPPTTMIITGNKKPNLFWTSEAERYGVI